MTTLKLFNADCLELLKKASSNSVDAVVTDPPYGLAFMGKKWDYDVPSVDIWREVLRVLKPGGHLLSFGGTRTYHRMVVAIEDAGFEIRDQIQWLYGSGFPKSLNIGKQTGLPEHEGFGTALKPANEPIVLARKPLSEATVAKNVLRWGTGGLNIDATRAPSGRFPANVILDEAAGAVLDVSLRSAPGEGPSRFFYAAKASKKERNEGLEKFPVKAASECVDREPESEGLNSPRAGANRTSGSANFHPTVKPVSLMEYLCKLITPVGGVVLDPFMGSGTTGVAAKGAGFGFIGIEREVEYFVIAKGRIERE